MSKDCNLKALYSSLQIFSKGMSLIPFLIERKKSQGVAHLEESSRTRAEFLVSGIGSHRQDLF